MRYVYNKTWMDVDYVNVSWRHSSNHRWEIHLDDSITILHPPSSLSIPLVTLRVESSTQIPHIPERYKRRPDFKREWIKGHVARAAARFILQKASFTPSQRSSTSQKKEKTHFLFSLGPRCLSSLLTLFCCRSALNVLCLYSRLWKSPTRLRQVSLSVPRYILGSILEYWRLLPCSDQLWKASSN